MNYVKFILDRKYLLTFKSFGTDTEELRNLERNRRILLSSIFSLVNKFVSLIMIMFSVPLTVNYLGAERYGMYMTLSSIIAVIGFADMGMGLGLQNCVANSITNSDKLYLKKNVSSAFFSLVFISLFLLFIFLIFYPFVTWYKFFNVNSLTAQNESSISMLIMFICFIVSIPFGIAQRVQIGFQEGYENSIWQIIGKIVGFVLLLICINLELGLPFLIISIYGINTLVTIIIWINQFLFKRKEIRPQFRYFGFNDSKSLFKIGGIFFLLQILAIIGSSSDNIIIAQFMGAANVATYAIVYKLFQLLITPAQSILEPMLPAYSEAIVRKDYQWINNNFKKTTLLVLSLSFITSVFLIFFGNAILKVWISKDIKIDWIILVSFGIAIFAANIGGKLTAILNTNLLIKKQLLFVTIATIVACILKILLIPVFGISSVVLGTIIGFSIFFYYPAYKLIYKTFRK